MAVVNGTQLNGNSAFTQNGRPTFSSTGFSFKGWFSWDGTGACALFNLSGENYDELNSSITAAGKLRFWTSTDGNTEVPSFTATAGGIYGFEATVTTAGVGTFYVWAEGATPSASSLTLTVGITSPVRDIELGRWEGGDYFRGWIEYFNFAQAVHTLAQVQTQATQKDPVTTAWATWHLEGASTADSSGNSHTLTADGTPTTASDGVDFGSAAASAVPWSAFRSQRNTLLRR